MSRGPHNFRQSDVAKAMKAAVKSGVKGWRIELVDGKIVICAGDDRGDHPVGEPVASEWD